MTRTFVKYGWTDEYGFAREERAVIEWFDNEELANQWIAEMKKNNGGYFKIWKVGQGNYNHYLEMIELKKRLKELEKEF